MNAATKIRRIGFRKWYERELLQSHMHLVLLLLSSIGVMGAAEAYSERTPDSSPLTILACALVSVIIGIWALRRYLFLLNHAEYMADQAVCGQCKAYAKWEITEEDSVGTRMRVRCRQCGHRWSITQ